MGVYEKQAKLFKALQHPARLAILDILRSGEQCVCHIEAILGYRQAYISQQLTVLRDAGLVQDRREGWNNYYRVTKPEVYHLIAASLDLLGASSPTTQGHSANIPLRESCQCPKCNPEHEPILTTESLGEDYARIS